MTSSTKSSEDCPRGEDQASLFASIENNPHWPELLIREARSYSAKDSTLFNFLFPRVCRSGHAGLVLQLLKHLRASGSLFLGTDPCADIEYIIQTVCEKGHWGVLAVLLQDPQIRDDPRFPDISYAALRTAAGCGDPNLVEAVVDYGKLGGADLYPILETSIQYGSRGALCPILDLLCRQKSGGVTHATRANTLVPLAPILLLRSIALGNADCVAFLLSPGPEYPVLVPEHFRKYAFLEAVKRTPCATVLRLFLDDRMWGKPTLDPRTFGKGLKKALRTRLSFDRTDSAILSLMFTRAHAEIAAEVLNAAGLPENWRPPGPYP